MKRFLVILCLLVGCVMIFGCDNKPTPSENSYPNSSSQYTQTTKEETPKEVTVYVTRTGSKYHRASCRYLAKSCIPMSLQEAKTKYGPCSVCNPPR
jgi:competence protein ComEC